MSKHPVYQPIDITFKSLSDKNRFFNFIIKYYEYIRRIKFDFDGPDKIIVNGTIFSKGKKYIVPESLTEQMRSLQFDRHNRVGYYQICNSYLDIHPWLTIVKEFIIFLDIMDLASLYKNDKGDCNLYVDCDEPNSSFVLYYYDESKETEYRLSFIDTDIPKMGTPSSIVTYINGTDDKEEQSITLIQIDILRRYGDKRTNQIKLVFDDNINNRFLNKKEDEIIFNVFQDMISRVIYDTFYDIVSNVNEIVGFDRNITEEVLHGHIKLSEN